MMITANVGFVTAKAIANHLNLTLPAVYGAVRQGVLPAHRLGKRRLRFRLDEVVAAMTPSAGEDANR